MPIIRPSTCAGTPLSSWSGTRPIRFGQFCRTRSWLPPMPPLATITACARNSNSPTVSRDDATPRAASVGSSTAPRTPTTAPSATIELVDPVPVSERDLVVAHQPSREDLDDRGSGPPGDVEARHRVAVPARVVAASLGPADQREGPAARARAASCASRPPRNRRRRAPIAAANGPRAGRTPRCPSQSCSASSWLSRMPSLRCSGLLTKNSPPNDQNACPPMLAAFSWSTIRTRRPRSTSSQAATSPASPAPTTMTSASAMAANLATRPVRRRRSAPGYGRHS